MTRKEELPKKVRRGQLRDYPRVNEIAVEEQNLHVALRPDLFSIKPEMVTLSDYQQWVKEKRIYVLEVDKQVRAFVLYTLKKLQPGIHQENRVMFITGFAVSKEFRRCGIGRTLMNSLVERARKLKCQRLELQLISANKAACAFYQNLAFSEKAKIMELKLEREF